MNHKVVPVWRAIVVYHGSFNDPLENLHNNIAAILNFSHVLQGLPLWIFWPNLPPIRSESCIELVTIDEMDESKYPIPLADGSLRMRCTSDDFYNLCQQHYVYSRFVQPMTYQYGKWTTPSTDSL